MSLSGIKTEPVKLPKLAKELKVRVTELLSRYSFAEVMAQIAELRPSFDIWITSKGGKHICPHCGHDL